MDKALRKIGAIVLITSIVLSVASCINNDADNSKKIAKDAPWFEANIYDVDSGVNHDKELQDLQQDFAGADDKYMVIYTHGAYLQSARSTSFDGVFYGYVLTVDKATGKVVNKIDVESSSYKSSDDNVRGVIYSNGIITIRTESKEQDHDPVTGEVLASRSIGRTNQYPSDSIKAGDYMVYVSYNWDNGSCSLEISSPSGDSIAAEIAEPDNSINNVFDIIPTGEDDALVFASTQKGRRYYELSLSSGNIVEADSKEYEWLDPDRLEDIITGTDGNIYCRTTSGLSRIDLSTKTVEEVFNYNWCDVNLGYISDWQVEVVDCTGDSLIFVGQIRNISYYEAAQKDFQIIELTRSNKNPHAGKTVLELYAPSMDISIGAAVLDYNANNQKYRIETIYRYNEQDYYSTEDVYNARNTDEDKLLRLSINSNMSNALITDIVAGKGPDILISSESYGQLNNPDYLADLTAYVKDLDPNLYFTNIIEGSKTGTALYQLPVGFFIHGIYTDMSVAGSSGAGFTLDEYKAFLGGTLNGTDIIALGQAAYFSELVNYMDDLFIADGKVNFDTPEFAELALYVKDNVPENGMSFDNVPEAYYENFQYAKCGQIQGIADFLPKKNYSSFISEPTVLGMPSVDGRGPMFESVCSFAISSQATDIDACGEFISCLLSEDVQKGLAMRSNFVLNRSAFRSAGEDLIDYFNNGDRSGRELSAEEKYTSADIDNIERIILSCSSMNSENSDMSMILIEEMPAYFLGQKDLDSVIVIIQDRVQKVLDERKQ